MSWDIVLFSSSQKINSPEEVDEAALIETNFSSVLDAHFEDIVKDKDHREIKGQDFSICYFVDNEPTSNTILNLYGESAIYPIIELSIKNKWQVFDTGLGEMIDLNNPSKNGYKNFQAYLSRGLNSKD
jgi:hypothetical protein